MLNERVPVYHQDQSFTLEKDSLLSGRMNMKTYLITQSNREIERLLQENKIYYLFKNHNEENQILFELFNEKKELIDQLKEMSNGNVHSVDILPTQFVGSFIRELQ